MVHQLVALTFIGPAEGRYTCHNDNDKTNNRSANLRYDSPLGNQADRVLHGTETYGSALPQAKLNEAQVAEIKRLLPTYTHAELGVRYGVCAATVSLIAAGKNWRRVKAKKD